MWKIDVIYITPLPLLYDLASSQMGGLCRHIYITNQWVDGSRCINVWSVPICMVMFDILMQREAFLGNRLVDRVRPRKVCIVVHWAERWCHTPIWLSNGGCFYGVFAVSCSLGRFITGWRPFVSGSEVVWRTGTARGPLLQFQESNWEQEDGSATGSGYSSLGDPLRNLPSSTTWSPCERRLARGAFLHKQQQHGRTSGWINKHHLSKENNHWCILATQ